MTSQEVARAEAKEAPFHEEKGLPLAPTVDQLQAQIELLRKEIATLHDADEEDLLKRQECTCPEKHFIRPNSVKPNHAGARETLEIARGLKSKKADTHAMSVVYKAAKVKAFLDALNIQPKSDKSEEYYGFLNDIGGNQFKSSFELKFFLQECGIAMDDKDIGHLASLLGIQSRYQTYFTRFLRTIRDTSHGGLLGIWREKALSGKEEAQKQKAELYPRAQDANQFAAAFFAPQTLHPTVEAIEDINELQHLASHTLPTNEETLYLLKSVIAKIRFMHLAETIHSKLDFGRINVEVQHLRRFLGRYTIGIATGKKIFTTNPKRYAHLEALAISELLAHEDYIKLDKGECSDAALVENIDVPNEKSPTSTARKLAHNDDDTGNYDPSRISDLRRFKIVLRQKDSDPNKTVLLAEGSEVAHVDMVIEKVMGLILGISGSDLAEDRLRYAINGEVSENSTGNHHAVHGTSGFRLQCVSNKIVGRDDIPVVTQPVEWQIELYETRDAMNEDHDSYVARKNANIAKSYGMELVFKDFIIDICDALIDYKFGKKVFYGDKAKVEPEYLDFPLEERLVRLLTAIILERNGSSNTPTLLDLLNNPHEREKIIEVLEYYSDPSKYRESKVKIAQARIESEDGDPFTGSRRWLRTGQQALMSFNPEEDTPREPESPSKWEQMLQAAPKDKRGLPQLSKKALVGQPIATSLNMLASKALATIRELGAAITEPTSKRNGNGEHDLPAL